MRPLQQRINLAELNHTTQWRMLSGTRVSAQLVITSGEVLGDAVVRAQWAIIAPGDGNAFVYGDQTNLADQEFSDFASFLNPVDLKASNGACVRNLDVEGARYVRWYVQTNDVTADSAALLTWATFNQQG